MATEKRLIDANAYPCQTCGVSYCYQNCKKLNEWFNKTVDAVEVVRCKDCKHWHEETGWCNQHSHFIGSKGEACHPWESGDWKMLDADDFCSYGERRTEC